LAFPAVEARSDLLENTNARYFLTTERLGFRWWQPDDLSEAIDLWGNPDVTRLFSKDPLTSDQIDQRLKQEIGTGQEHHIQYWPIFTLSDDRCVGCAGLRPFSDQTLELGIHLKPQHWRQGFAIEAGQAVVKHAFDSNLAQALFAGHHPDNKGSRSVLLKLGFLGTSSRFYEPTGLFHPSYFLYRNSRPVTMRPATANDARALAIVHCYSIRDTFGGLLDDYVAARSLDYCEDAWQKRLAGASLEAETIVLVRGEQIIGFASAAPSPDDDIKNRAGELARIYIHPSVCGGGYGNRLIEWCEQTVAEQGFDTIKLWVFEVNTRAIRFYEKHGYKYDGCSKSDFGGKLLRYGKALGTQEQ
jgi:RimJ/RimL family protein N-acetyltransferase